MRVAYRSKCTNSQLRKVVGRGLDFRPIHPVTLVSFNVSDTQPSGPIENTDPIIYQIKKKLGSLNCESVWLGK
jgi:hypothetical protein